MKVFIGALFVLSFSPVKSQAQTVTYWKCSYGDAKITAKLTEGKTQFDFDICNFGFCSEDSLKQNASFVSASASSTSATYIYESENTYGRERLTLKFAADGGLETLDIKKVDGTSVGHFNMCISSQKASSFK